VGGRHGSLEEASDTQLAALVLDGLTADVLAKRDKGYIPLGILAQSPRAAATELARRSGSADADGAPAEAGRLMVGIWSSRSVIVRDRNGEGYPYARWLYESLRPPTAEVVPAEPMAGSILWWLWPHATAKWGTDPVSLPAGRYTLEGLVESLGEQTEVVLRVDPRLPKRRLLVAASGVDLRTVLWAVEIAVGYPVRLIQNADGQCALLFCEERSGRRADLDAEVLLRLPAMGYQSPLGTDVGA